jgi:hypothetical protein
MDEAILLGVRDGNPGLADRNTLRVPYLVYFSIGQAENERFKRLAVDPIASFGSTSTP